MEVGREILLLLSVLVSPIDLDLCVKDFSAIERVECVLCVRNSLKLDKAVIETAVLKIAVWDELDANDGSECRAEAWLSMSWLLLCSNFASMLRTRFRPELAP